jgi:hypothetical protein
MFSITGTIGGNVEVRGYNLDLDIEPQVGVGLGRKCDFMPWKNDMGVGFSLFLSFYCVGIYVEAGFMRPFTFNFDSADCCDEPGCMGTLNLDCGDPTEAEDEG